MMALRDKKPAPAVQRDASSGRRTREGSIFDDGVGDALIDSPSLAASPLARYSRILNFTTYACGHFAPRTTAGKIGRVCSRGLTVSWCVVAIILSLIDDHFANLLTDPAFMYVGSVVIVSFLVLAMIAADREREPHVSAVLELELRDTPPNSLARDLKVGSFALVVTLAQAYYAAFAPHEPNEAATEMLGERGARAALGVILALLTLASISAILGVQDCVLRIGWWMSASTAAIVRFEEAVLAEAALARALEPAGTPRDAALAAARAEDGNTRAAQAGIMSDTLKRSIANRPRPRAAPPPPPPPPAEPAAAAAAEMSAAEQDATARGAAHRMEDAFEAVEGVVEEMNRTYEASASALFILGVCQAVIMTRAAARSDIAYERAVLASWALFVGMLALGVAVWTSRVGDTFVHARARIQSPTAMLRLVRLLRKERFDVFNAGLERAHVGFQIANLTMTTATVARFVFGIALTVGVTVLHAQHEEHREHMIAEEMVHGLHEIELEAEHHHHEHAAAAAGAEAGAGGAHGSGGDAHGGGGGAAAVAGTAAAAAVADAVADAAPAASHHLRRLLARTALPSAGRR